MSANDEQVGGNHYKGYAIQPWDFFLANAVPYLEACIIKYTLRWRNKNGLEDLEKAKHYLDKLIEVAKEEARAAQLFPLPVRMPPLDLKAFAELDGQIPGVKASPLSRGTRLRAVDVSDLGRPTVDWSDLK